MPIQTRAMALRCAVLIAASAVPAGLVPDTGFSPLLIDALDPTRLAASLCGPRRAGYRPAFALMAAAVHAAPASATGAIPLYADLAGSSFALSTRNPLARRWFSQGLMLAYGFNHAGAVASFRAAQRLDPGCALCWWGEAMALGPNINAPMDGRDRGAALAALDRALALRDTASPMEQALIAALATRYSRDESADRAALDMAYADAMLAVAARFPAEDDVAALAAEAVMDTSPWNYWQADGKTPVGRIVEAVRLVEGVLARSPAHVQAMHLYVHMMEANDPQRAEPAADRLAAARVPSAGHLVHMPAHIWHRRGRYRESIAANIAAARADEAYITATDDRSMVRYAYHPHNVHFIVTSAMMAGDTATALREARRLGTLMDVETSARIGTVQAVDAAPFQAMAQIAGPQVILAMPAPDARLPLANAMRHYARAVARAALDDRAGFDAELAALQALKSHPGARDLIDQALPLPDLITMADAVARGRWAMLHGQYQAAASQFRAAAAIEATIPYMEPAYWHYPVQQSLGAALLLAGDHAGASAAFRAALVQTPNNGWALYGLARSEAAAGHRAEAAAASVAFGRAWAGDRRWLKVERL
jgi:tetratricopeptide (TPR) repeat protein